MKEPQRALGDYLTDEVSAARLERQWAGVRQKLEAPVGPPFWLRLPFVLSCAGLMVASWLAMRGASTVAEQVPEGAPAVALQEIAPTARLRVFPDGSHIELGEEAKLGNIVEQPRSLKLELSQGRATFDVAPNAERQFSVEVGQVAVVVLGTRFTVERSLGEVTVFVERGQVQVQRAGEVVVTLGPNERWSGPEQAPEPSLGNPNLQPEAPPNEPARDEVKPPEEKPEEKVERGRELFEAAREARRRGDFQGASRLLEELLERHSSDPRAALAAFDLGRLRMDSMGDPAGALAAFERAIALRPGAGFHEDALARIVTACDRIGCPSCVRARQRYLASYPRGVHASEVVQRCQGK